MTKEQLENLKVVQHVDKDMLDYFNQLYLQKLEQVQGLKTEHFELSAKINELIKTLDAYSFKSSAGRNVFSPFAEDTTKQEDKAAHIAMQLSDLNDVKKALDKRLEGLESEIAALKTKIGDLNDATKKLALILDEAQEEEALVEEPEEEETPEDTGKPPVNHGINILRLDKYTKDSLAADINESVQSLLDGNRHKLEVLSWLIKSDINRAKLTLDELIASTNNLSYSLSEIIDNLRGDVDVSQPLWTLLSDTIFEFKDKHPECVIESDIDCPEYDVNIPDIVIINLIYIIREIFENAFKHSNANRIVAKIFVSNHLVDVYINDNGIGINSNFTFNAPWYSGLHRIEEILYLLEGELKVDGDIITGTNVRFSFPVKGETL